MPLFPYRVRKLVFCFVGIAALSFAQTIEPGALKETRIYIRHTWRTLERSNQTRLKSALDTKVGQTDALTLYVARDESPQSVQASLRQILPPDQMNRITVRQLLQD